MRTSDTLNTGDRAPEFTLSAANRPGTFSLAELRKTSPLIVEFLRGTWCPNCKKRMAQMETYREELKRLDVALVYIAAEKRDGMFHPEQYLKDHPISFPFLLDEDRSVTKSYGVYHWLAKDAINIARPASMLVDREGIVRFVYVGEGQTDRAPVEQLLEAVGNLPADATRQL